MIATGTSVGPYRVERELGRGGMGVVYEASHAELDRRVALKLLSGELSADGSFVERFRREGRIQASLEHPHVIPVYEAGESEHGLYIAMALVRGPTLAALLRTGELDAERALRLLGQVAAALDAAHAAGLVHRDVKPQNVLVGAGDHAYLCDFGLTKASARTSSGLMGTAAHLAPELIAGQPATPASDRYAFAAMMFECLSGDVVFPRTSDAAVLFAHSSEPPPKISRRRDELPAALDGLFAAALSKDPAQRPDSASGLVAGVTAAIEPDRLATLGSPPARTPVMPATTVTPPVAAPRLARRTLAVVGAVGALAGAGLALGIAAIAGGGDDDAAPPVLAGARVLGGDLATAGRSLDCRGRPPAPDSPGCSIVQTNLSGHTLVAPSGGVIHRWGVRGVRGEVALQVMRKREGKTYQIAASRSEFVPDERVHLFDTELEMERGDFIGLKAIGGAAVGVRPGVGGARTERWLPPLGGSHQRPDLGTGTGFDHELQLRAEYVPGARRRPPRQITGAAAAALPAGHPLESGRIRFANGTRVAVALVQVRGAVALDLFRGEQRVSRVDLPGFRPDGRVIYFEALASAEEAAEDEGNVYVEYVNADSERILDHYLLVHAREFVLTQ